MARETTPSHQSMPPSELALSTGIEAKQSILKLVYLFCVEGGRGTVPFAHVILVQCNSTGHRLFILKNNVGFARLVPVCKLQVLNASVRNRQIGKKIFDIVFEC